MNFFKSSPFVICDALQEIDDAQGRAGDAADCAGGALQRTVSARVECGLNQIAAKQVAMQIKTDINR